jgi:hypothetical protein
MEFGLWPLRLPRHSAALRSMGGPFVSLSIAVAARPPWDEVFVFAVDRRETIEIWHVRVGRISLSSRYVLAALFSKLGKIEAGQASRRKARAPRFWAAGGAHHGEFQARALPPEPHLV